MADFVAGLAYAVSDFLSSTLNSLMDRRRERRKQSQQAESSDETG